MTCARCGKAGTSPAWVHHDHAGLPCPGASEEWAAALANLVRAALPEFRAALEVGWNEGATPSPSACPEYRALCEAVGQPVLP